MQVGNVGLLKAINNFDPAFGGSLAACAQPCISGEMKRDFRDRHWQVRVNRSAQELLLEVRQASADLAQQLGRSPADAELARHLGVSDADLPGQEPAAAPSPPSGSPLTQTRRQA
jgi:RNA polymerase sigma-B factor